MEYPKVAKIEHGEYKGAYEIAIARNFLALVTENELIRLFEEIDEALPPNTIERTISERVTALECAIGECPCHNH